MNDFTKPLANSIRQAHARLGLTQEQVAELANTDPNSSSSATYIRLFRC